MFTGLIFELGKIKYINATNNTMYLTVACSDILEGLKIGDSVAINGACQTVTEIFDDSFTVFSSTETLKVTNFNDLRIGSFVNLERALRLCDRLDGHIVSGHIDSVAKITYINKSGETNFIHIDLPSCLTKQIVKKGSITVDGISLTIADIQNNTVVIAVIPHTMEHTNLKYRKIGDFVNIETDVIAKYVEKYLSSNNNSNITMELLERNGFL